VARINLEQQPGADLLDGIRRASPHILEVSMIAL